MQEQALSVSQLNEYIRMLMEGDALLSEVVVAGEISNYTESRAGHLYFTLKDADGQLRAVMFRGAASRLAMRPCDGMRVIAYGRISVYAPSGQYQLYVEALRADGVGQLARQFEELRRRLEREGLFDASRKRPLPPYPRRIGLLTSPYGAAVRDLIRILSRRYPAAEIRLVPSLVQGAEAPAQLIEGLRFLEREGDVDVIILGRGGGSAEDLWAFNDEMLVRAIAACRLPVISAVGHENDYTLCDYVADLRASTPSAAAELAVPEREELLRMLRGEESRLTTLLVRRLERARQAAVALSERSVLAAPERWIAQISERADRVGEALDGAIERTVEHLRASLSASAGRLEALSPVAVLRRGYTALYTSSKAVVSVEQVACGDEVRMRLADGELTGRIIEKTENRMDEHYGR